MWWWVLIWTVLVLGALAVLGLLGWHIFKLLLGLGRELGDAAERLSVVTEELDRLQRQTQQGDGAPAVFADPAALRAERARRHRGGSRRRTSRVR